MTSGPQSQMRPKDAIGHAFMEAGFATEGNEELTFNQSAVHWSCLVEAKVRVDPIHRSEIAQIVVVARWS